MKAIITFVIVVAMCLELTACGNRMTIKSSKEENTEVTAVTQPVDDRNTDRAAEEGTADKVADAGATDKVAEDGTWMSVPAGPWHLDHEKTDISAIESAWETFPGYGEWGAGMEIRSDGQMSWYIGAVGGFGIYTVEADLLHAELTDSMEQKKISMDFQIIGKESIKMTYADREIIWAYGDREDIPENDK